MPKEIYRIEIPIETVDEYSKGLEKAKKDIEKFEKAVGATTKDVEDLGDTAKKTEKEVKGFGDSTKKVTKQVDDLGSSYDKTISKVSKFDKSMSRMQRRLDRINKRRDLIIGVKDFATRTINRIDRMTNRLIRGSYRFTINAIDRATRIIGAIKRSIFSIPTAITVALSVVGVNKLKDSTVGAAMNFEDYGVAMNHWLRGDKKAADELMTWMGQKADKTPYSSPDIFPAMVGAVSLAGNDQASIKRLTSAAIDMAALSGGTRTVDDAMQAIIGAKMGNYQMLKGFGLNITKKDFDKMGWDGFISHIEGEFQGGAEELSKTARGILATLRGYRGSMLRTLGDGILLPMKPRLDAINKWLENNQKTWGRWKGVVQDAGKQASEWLFSSLEKGFSYIKANYLENDEFKKLDFKGKIKFVWEDVKDVFSSKIQPKLEEWWKDTGKPWAAVVATELGALFFKGIINGIKEGFSTLWEMHKNAFSKEGNIAGVLFADAFLAIVGVKIISGVIKILKGAKFLWDFVRGFSPGGSGGGAPTPGNTRSTRSEKHNKNGNSKGGNTNATRSERHTPKTPGGGWSRLLRWGGGPLAFLTTFLSDPLSVSAADLPLDYDSASGKNAFGGTAAKPNKFNTPSDQLQGEPKGGDIQSASSLLTEKITNSATSFQTLDETIKGFGGNVDAASEFFMEGITSAGSHLREFAEWTMQLAAVITTSGLMMVIALQQNALHLSLLATVTAFMATGMMGSGIELISSMQMSTLSINTLGFGTLAISSGIITSGTMLLASILQTNSSFRTLSAVTTTASSWVLSINGIQTAANSVKSALISLTERINNVKLPSIPSLSSGGNSSGNVSRGATLSAYANGGYINRPHLGLVGEAGPEMIIPLSSGRRNRAMELYERTGQMLGVKPYKDGGLVGKFIDNNESGIKPATGTTIVIDGVKTEVNITVQGDSEIDTKGLGKKIADDVAFAIARAAKEAAKNMPIPAN